MTLSIMTLSIMTLSIMTLDIMTISIMTNSIITLSIMAFHTKYCYSESHLYSVPVIRPLCCVTMQNVVMLNVVAP